MLIPPLIYDSPEAAVQATCARRCFVGLIAVLCWLASAPVAQSQSSAFRDSRTYVGVGLGVYTFHGPVDLWKPRSGANFVRKKDPAFLANITFPVTRSRLYMRGQIGYTPGDRQYGADLLISGENEFIVNDLAWFEADAIVTLRPPTRRIVPYLFGGVGLLLADPFERTTAHRDSIPVEHVKRTQFYFPIGVGVDLAVTRRVSLYLESGLRLSRNSVFLDRAEPDPFNSTILLAGLRFALGNQPRPVVEIDQRSICPICPLPKVGYEAPLGELPGLRSACCACAIQDLQTVSFENGLAVLDDTARDRLNENLDALALAENSNCTLIVSGYYDETEQPKIADRRIAIVVKYYLDMGLPENRIRPGDSVKGDESCGKKGGAPSCSTNRRVETMPFCSFGPTCTNPDPPRRYSPLQEH